MEYAYKLGNTHCVPDFLSRQPHGDLAALSVEPTFMQNVASHLSEDVELAPLLIKACGSDPGYCLMACHGVELLIRNDGNYDQLLIPAGHGLCLLLMEEAHVSAIGGHLGVRKMLTVTSMSILA